MSGYFALTQVNGGGGGFARVFNEMSGPKVSKPGHLHERSVPRQLKIKGIMDQPSSYTIQAAISGINNREYCILK